MTTHRLMRAMKLRRVMRCAAERGGSEVRADGECDGKTTEEGVRLVRLEGGRAGASRRLLLHTAISRHGRNPVARTHAVQRRKALRRRDLVEVDGARWASERIVPHIHLEGPHRREGPRADAWRPAHAVQPERARLVHDGARTPALPHVA